MTSAMATTTRRSHAAYARPWPTRRPPTVRPAVPIGSRVLPGRRRRDRPRGWPSRSPASRAAARPAGAGRRQRWSTRGRPQLDVQPTTSGRRVSASVDEPVEAVDERRQVLDVEPARVDGVAGQQPAGPRVEDRDRGRHDDRGSPVTVRTRRPRSNVPIRAGQARGRRPPGPPPRRVRPRSSPDGRRTGHRRPRGRRGRGCARREP